MPIISVSRDALFAKLERTYTKHEFEDLCFAFGIELDGETSEKELIRKEQGDAAAEGKSDEILYKIDCPANRYDILSLEGLARALRVFLELDPPCKPYLVKPFTTTLHVQSSVNAVRPYCVAAVLRGFNFNQKIYDSFIQLQEKLHQNICRERSLVAIGTHDLDTIVAPFSYEALDPKTIEFVPLQRKGEEKKKAGKGDAAVVQNDPLREKKAFKADDLLEYYDDEKNQSHLKKYVPLIKHSPVYPVIYDSKRVVLSLPPIINGEHSKITLNTKNIFIECTATDLTKAEIVLNTMIASFVQYADHVESVNVVYEGGCVTSSTSFKERVYPNLSYRTMETDINYLNKGIGIDTSREKAMQLLKRMDLNATAGEKEGQIIVQIPPTRPDILHVIDIQEDLAIAYGYNNITKTVPRTMTVGHEQPVNHLTDLVREALAQSGFIEVLTWAMISRKDNFLKMELKDDAVKAVSVVPGTSKQAEFEIIRTSLIPGLLKTIAANRGHTSLPIDIFEVSDVCFLDESRDTASRNERRAAVVHCGKTSGFEVVHGVLDRLMMTHATAFVGDTSGAKTPRHTYQLKPLSENHLFSPAFFPGLSAEVHLDGVAVGVLGVIHPLVLQNFEIDAPCSVLEINIEPLLK
jgi:phenylalanyl-tRNA synthetase beta chain